MDEKIFKWFKNYLEYQVEDIKTEELGYRNQTYFDTYDVQDLLLGIDAFYLSQKFNNTKFELNSTTALCLFSAGWLGQIRMFPPHQAELLNKINLEFGISNIMKSDEEINEFLFACSVLEDLNKKINLEKMDDEDIKRLIKSQYGKAPVFFKAIQLLRHVSWKGRLKYFITGGILKLKYEKADYNEILKDDLFIHLLNEFQKKRQKLTKNNLADAIAITLLRKKILDVKNKSTNIIPIFYLSESNSNINHILKDENIANEFRFRNVSLVRDPVYFIFKCMFRPRIIGHKNGEQYWRDEEVIKLYDEINDIESNQDLTYQEADRKIIKGKTLNDIIYDLTNLTFLENVWLRLLAEEDVQKIKYEITILSKDVRYRDEVKQIIVDTKKIIEENANEYKWLAKIWSLIEKESLNQSNYFKSDMRLDPYKQFGLLRFAIPNEYKQYISDTYFALIERENGLLNEALKKIIGDLVEIRNTKNIQQCLERYFLVTPLLWIFDLDQENVKILSYYENLPNISLVMFYLASMLRGGHINITKHESMMMHIKESYIKEKDQEQKAQIGIGYAYLLFHNLLSQGFKAKWRTGPKTESVPGAYDVIVEASDIAYEAYVKIGSDIEKKVYALNQCLYYLVEGSDDSKMEIINAIAKELISYKSEKGLWNYRYDDTLARYFHRIALRNKEINFLYQAIDHINLSYSKSYGDISVESYKSELASDLIIFLK